MNTSKNTTITITFGDCGENHVGMQKIGSLASDGFTTDELMNIQKTLESSSIKCEYVNLNELLDATKLANIPSDDAAILIIRKGVDFLLNNADTKNTKTSLDMFNEQIKLNWDTKAKMYNRVVNKKARYNLCYDISDQEPDYENGKGTIVSFSKLPCLNDLKTILPVYFGNKCKSLVAEV